MKIFLMILMLSAICWAQPAKSGTVPLKPNDTAPDFELKDQNGEKYLLSKAAGNVVLVFYRGYW